MSTILRWEHVMWNVADSTGFHQSQWWYTPACWDGRLDGRPEVIWAACPSHRRPRIGRTRQSKRPTCHPRTGQSTLRSRRSGFPPIEAWNAACSVWLFQKPCTVIRVHVVDEIDELFSPSPFSHRVGFFFVFSVFNILFIIRRNVDEWNVMSQVETAVVVIRSNCSIHASSHSTLFWVRRRRDSSINNQHSYIMRMYKLLKASSLP